MKLGIKTGLKSDWKTDLETARPYFCEFWFHSGKIDEYEPLFEFCKQQNIQTGLHFWGILPGSIQANLAYPDKEILKKSLDLVKLTIDAAAKWNSLYVNVHPGEATITLVDFEKEIFKALTPPQPFSTCQKILYQSIEELAEYGKRMGIPLYVESVPQCAPGTPWHGTESRKMPVELFQIPVEEVEKVLDIPNVYFTNDFGHTAGNVISENREEIREYLFNVARRLQDKTKLLHVSYIIPPYNGTDYHGSLYYDEFKTITAIPNYLEMLELLKLFENRGDVYALVEPEKDHPGNFKTLQKLVQEIS